VILLIDNYDSFTFNLLHSLERTGAEVVVRRNDALSLADALAMEPEAVVLGPGPGSPHDPQSMGITFELLAGLPEALPVLGVCLGHQALVLASGGRLELDPIPVHGRASLVRHSGAGILRGLPDPFPAGRYHSIRAAREGFPEALRLTAWTEDGIAMAVEHRRLPRFGVQFHPESILTPDGDRLIENFVLQCAPRAPEDVSLEPRGLPDRSPR
jgi:anthranilate synthase component II